MAAISYEVTLLNQEAPVVISSEMLCHMPEVRKADDDPRRAKMFSGDVLQHRAGYMRDRRIVLAHGTERSRMIVACGIDHELETDCQHSYKSSHTDNSGQVAFSVAALPGKPIHLTKYMAYHTATIANPESLCDRVEWTLDRTAGQGFATAVAGAGAVSGQLLAAKRRQRQQYRCGAGKAHDASKSSRRSASICFTFCRLQPERKRPALQRRG